MVEQRVRMRAGYAIATVCGSTMDSSLPQPRPTGCSKRTASGRARTVRTVMREAATGRRVARLPSCTCATSLASVVLFLLLLLRAGEAAAAKQPANRGDRLVEQRFAMEPQDQTAIVGSRVTLPCRVVNKSGQLQWTKDDFGLGTHRNLSGFERYSMVGSDEEGDYSLDISPVMLDDDAKYQCQVGPGKGGTPGIRSRFAKLTVLVPPEAPKIVQGDYMVTTAGREIELECVSVGGKPAAEITWIDGLGNVLANGIEYMKEPLRDARRYTAKSILKLTPKKEHHNTTFTCQAQNTADRTYRSVRLKLEVKYAPKVHIAVIGGALSGGRILEGTEVRLSCHADANPQDLTYRWYVGEQLSEGSPGQEWHILNVSRQYHGTVVRCEVRNAVGTGEDSITLDISYGPSFRARPNSIEAELDSTVTLVCDVDGNPEPDILWVYEPEDRIVASAPNLTLSVTQATAGRYYCRASVPGFPEVAANANVLLRGPPIISSPRQQFGTVRDHAQLECVAQSIPRPRQIVWSRNGRELNVSEQTGEAGYRAFESQTPTGVRATLVVSQCRPEHFGLYNCTVVNEYGVDFLEIDFISQEQNLIPIIVLGSLGGITFLIIVILIGLCLCSRRNKKKHLPPADVIPKYDFPGKDCDGGSAGAHNGSRKIDRNSDLLEGETQRDRTTNIALSVRTSDASGVSTTADVIQSPLAVLKGDVTTDCCRYSGDFSDSLSHLQTQAQKQQTKAGRAGCGSVSCGNGYVPYVNYSRDYSPSAQQLMQFKVSTSNSSIENGASTPSKHQLPAGTMTLTRKRPSGPEPPIRAADKALPSIQSSVSPIPNGLMNQPGVGCHLGMDMRIGTSYGTLRARGSNSPLGLQPLQLPLPPPATANPSATPAPPPYNAARVHVGVLELGLQASAGASATNSGCGLANATTAVSSGSPSSTQSGSLSLASTQLSQGPPVALGTTVGMQQQQQQGNTLDQFILPSSGSAKPVMLATHV